MNSFQDVILSHVLSFVLALSFLDLKRSWPLEQYFPNLRYVQSPISLIQTLVFPKLALD